MKKTKIYLTCTLLLTAIFVNCAFSQTYFNKDWVQYTSTPDTVEWSSSTIDHAGYLITTGNKFDSTELANIMIIKYDDRGIVLWEQSWNSTYSKSDYGIAICNDIYNDIYVVGASYHSSDSTFDIVLLKYSSTGSLQWSSRFDGYNENDYPLDVSLDDFGNIYVTGTSEGTSTSFDFITLKYNSLGQLQWSKSYDYNGHTDIASDILITENGTRITVAGGSEDSTGIWDHTTIMYDENGTQLNVSRVPTAGFDIKNPKIITKDQNQNFYIASERINGTDIDIKVIKFDSTLNPLWSRHYCGNYDEKANTIAYADNGDLYVGGWQEDSSNNRNFLLLKYNSQGHFIWSRTLSPVQGKPISEITKLKTVGNFINVLGFAKNSYNCDIVCLRYDSSGLLRFKDVLDGIGQQSIEYPTSLLETNDDIYISGWSQNDSGRQWLTVKYSYFEASNEIIEDSNSIPICYKKKILIRFIPEVVNTTFVDNKELQFISLNSLIPDSVKNSMSSKTGFSFTENPITAVKAMSNMTTKDSLSITRLGDTIRIPEFWTMFVLDMPDSTDIFPIIDSLNSLDEYIYYAEANNIVQPDAISDDPLLITQQESLIAYPDIATATYPFADINIEEAWDIEVGQAYVKVGVVDHGIFWAHEDFGDGTFSGSKIIGGKRYHGNNIEISNYEHPLFSSHGTASAGIIGAYRNNDLGIAGIAGGNMSKTPNPNPGVSLISLDVTDIFGQGLDEVSCIEAIIEGATSTTSSSFGYGCHVLNNSWSNSINYNHNNTSLSDAVAFAHRNQCVVVASRGNSLNGTSETAEQYPACFKDEWVICVGASGHDGELKRIAATNGDDWYTSRLQWTSMHDIDNNGALDVIAPGVTEIVATTQDPSLPMAWLNEDSEDQCAVNALGDNKYSCFKRL
jgi:hypothetical protein